APGGRSRSVRTGDLAQSRAWGIAQSRVVPVVRTDRIYGTAQVPWGKKPLGLVAAREAVHVARVGRAMTERVVAPDVVSLPVRKGQRLGRIRGYDRGRLVARGPLVAAPPVRSPGTPRRKGVDGGRAVRPPRG